jgi:hypothetical protein
MQKGRRAKLILPANLNYTLCRMKCQRKLCVKNSTEYNWFQSLLHQNVHLKPAAGMHFHKRHFVIAFLSLAFLSISGVAGELRSVYAPPGPFFPLVYRGNPPTATPLPAKVLISEVLYDPGNSVPGGTPQDGEWIELFNAGGTAFDLAGCRLGDEETRGGSEGMLIFPAGAVIAPGQVILVANRSAIFHGSYGRLPDYEMWAGDPAVPDMKKDSSWARGNILLENSEDEVILMDAGDGVIDALSWGRAWTYLQPPVGNVSPGHSLERRPADRDTGLASDWVDQDEPSPGEVDTRRPTPTPSRTPTATRESSPSPTTKGSPHPTSTATSGNTPVPTLVSTATNTPTATKTPEPTPVQGWLLISEVMVNPFGNEPGAEWIELVNAGGTRLDLAGYRIGDAEEKGGNEGMYILPDDAGLDPGEVLVIANKAEDFYLYYSFFPDYEIQPSLSAVPDLEPDPEWWGGLVSLHNLGDALYITDPDFKTIDALSWGSSTWAFPEPIPLPELDGESYERRPLVDTDSAADWISQHEPNPGEKP